MPKNQKCTGQRSSPCLHCNKCNSSRIDALREGQLFVLSPEAQQNPQKATIYMRASGIEGYPTSVAQIIYAFEEPALCGIGAFPGTVALHTEVYVVELKGLKGFLPPEVYEAIELIQHTASK